MSRKETKVLSKALHEMEEENKLLKQKNASVIRMKEHYEYEIPCLNKALLDVLEKQDSHTIKFFGNKVAAGFGYQPRGYERTSESSGDGCHPKVQIYEEDIRKERSDRERLNEEKEPLKSKERLQSHLNKLSSQMKDFPVQPERPSYPTPLYLSPCVNYGNCGLVLHYQDPRARRASHRAHEQQQHSRDYQWYVPDQFPPDVQHKANVTPGTWRSQNIDLHLPFSSRGISGGLWGSSWSPPHLGAPRESRNQHAKP
ncbi:LOW QUALITY PROTEIN: TNFAIP3-interacting protein 3 [Phaethornis superciliosus]